MLSKTDALYSTQNALLEVVARLADLMDAHPELAEPLGEQAQLILNYIKFMRATLKSDPDYKRPSVQ